MAALKRLIGAYMALVGVAVAVYFIINNFLVDSIDVMSVWYVLDVLMAVGLGLALVFNYAYKREQSNGDVDGPVTRRYLEATALFHLTVVGHHPVPAQLAVAAGPWRGQPGRQRPGVEHLGRCGHPGAHHPGSHRLPPLA